MLYPFMLHEFIEGKVFAQDIALDDFDFPLMDDSMSDGNE